MSQRVNITYSVNVEELPEEVMRLLRKGEEGLQKTLGELKLLTKDNVLTSSSTDQVDQIRRNLATVDTSLSDASNIVEGYLSYEATLRAPQEGHSDSLEPPLDALIEQFRTSIEQLDEISPSSTTE
tara:strand:+ start:813 stop:1190 length:378 start_codon:yes stop_codon:yes gene_type:complete